MATIENIEANLSELSDADYIQWAQRDSWSKKEAIFLLHGFTVQDQDPYLRRTQLLTLFPDLRNFIEGLEPKSFPKYPEQKIKRIAPKIPEEWLAFAISTDVEVTNSW